MCQHRICHYGLFGSGICAASIASVRSLLGTGQSDPVHAHDGTAGSADARARVLVLPYPGCGGQLTVADAAQALDGRAVRSADCPGAYNSGPSRYGSECRAPTMSATTIEGCKSRITVQLVNS